MSTNKSFLDKVVSLRPKKPLMPNKYYLVAVLLLLIMPAIFHDKSYIMHTFTLCLIWGVVASAWNLMLGYAAIFSFGNIAFFTFGAYASAMLSMQLGISPWLGMLAGGAIAAIVGVGIGLPCLRLRGIYIAVVTLGLHLMLPTLIHQGREYGTGSRDGLSNIPPLYFGGYTFDRLVWYYFGLALFLLFLFAIYKIINSRVGLAFITLRDGEVFAKSLGVNEFKYKLIVFGISSFITGIMGAFYVHYMGMISPTILSTDRFLMVIAMVLFGGLGHFPGAALGAFAITFANELLRPTGGFRLLILGAIIVVTMIYMPGGLIGALESFGRLVSSTFKRGLEKLKQKNPIQQRDDNP